MEQAAFITSALCKIRSYRIKGNSMGKIRIVCGEMINVNKILVWIREGQRPLRAWRRSKWNTEFDV